MQWRNVFSYELQKKKDIECYDKVMDIYPNYPKIWWHNLVLAFKQKIKGYSDIKLYWKRLKDTPT
ncbi:MAG TPA: hypothetical protein VFP49_02365 [Nitrososphaeraceae archaeon]|nr:hypothetical protein [Nitrososphaeraceae archaeon]